MFVVNKQTFFVNISRVTLHLQPVILLLQQGREVDQECLQVAVLVVMAIKSIARKETKSLKRKRFLYLFD